MSCRQCFSGGVHDHAEPTGHEEVKHGKTCYIAEAPANEAHGKPTIICITDAFGLKLINNKLLADAYARKTGCRVIVPDIVPGGPASLSLIDSLHQFSQPVAWYDVFGQVRRLIAGIGVLWVLIPFLRRANPPKSYPVVLQFVRAVRNELPLGTKLGVAGFCWGGYASTRLCMEFDSSVPTNKRLIDAQFCAHPSGLTLPQMVVDAISAKVPYCMAIGDRDVVVRKTEVENLEAAIRQTVGVSSSANPYEIRSYEGCTHGFAVRAHPDDKHEMQCSELAKDQATEWFKKYL
jgi:dienelactone hydrolase